MTKEKIKEQTGLHWGVLTGIGGMILTLIGTMILIMSFSSERQEKREIRVAEFEKVKVEVEQLKTDKDDMKSDIKEIKADIKLLLTRKN